MLPSGKWLHCQANGSNVCRVLREGAYREVDHGLAHLLPPLPLPPHLSNAFRVYRSRFGVKGSGSRVQILGFGVESLELMIDGVWFMVQDLGFRVLKQSFLVSGLGFRVWGLGFGVEGLGLRVWGCGFRHALREP